MQVKEIEAVRIKRGETLVVIPPGPMPAESQRRLLDHADRTGINLIVLPHGSRLYLADKSPVRTKGGYQPAYGLSSKPPGAE